MDRNGLVMFLPAFMVSIVCLLFFWTFFRKSRRLRIVPTAGNVVRRVSTVKTAFLMLLSLAVSLALLYAYLPEYYDLMIPIELLDHPLVNAAGILILQVSFVWLVVAQLNIDRVIFQINSGLDEWSYQRLTLYSHRLLLSGLLILFIGVFVTISSVGTIAICFAGVALFERLPKAIG
jgi:hypothetical protein